VILSVLGVILGVTVRVVLDVILSDMSVLLVSRGFRLIIVRLRIQI